jgi:hypothetical protein
MRKVLLSIITVAVLWGACESDYVAPPYGCSDYTMLLSMQDSSTRSLTVSNNTYFLTNLDTAGYKFLSLEAQEDSFKIIINLKDGPYYDNAALLYDSLAVTTYHYGKHSKVSGGLVMVGVKAGNGIQYYETDSSEITLTRWNVQSQTMSGSYYFEANNRTVNGRGTFTNVCFLPLK